MSNLCHIHRAACCKKPSHSNVSLHPPGCGITALAGQPLVVAIRVRKSLSFIPLLLTSPLNDLMQVGFWHSGTPGTPEYPTTLSCVLLSAASRNENMQFPSLLTSYSLLENHVSFPAPCSSLHLTRNTEYNLSTEQMCPERKRRSHCQ